MGTLQEHLAAVKEFIEDHPELDVIQGSGFIPTPDMGPNGPTADLHIEGISGFILSGLMDAHKEKAYLVTTGYNRNMIRFRRSGE